MNQTSTIERQAAEQTLSPPPSRGEVIPFVKQEAQKAYPPKIAKALMAITREFGAIAKAKNEEDPNGGWNTFHKYGYQKWEDVLQRESDLLVKHNIIIQQSEIARSLLDKLISISYEFTIINDDGDFWPDRPVFTAIGRLQDNKGIFDDKAANKCHTQAHKYFLLHTFKIKTKEAVHDDADATDDEAATKQITAPKPPKPPKPGSPEAQKMEGPRTIDYRGMSYEQFVDAYLALIGTAQSSTVIDEWAVKNKDALAKLEVGNPEQHTRRINESAKLYTKFKATFAPAKPPRPGAAPAPAAETIPGTDDIKAFLAWLDSKLAAFDDGEKADQWWNDVVAPRVEQLDGPTQEDCLGVWSKHEVRWN